MVDTNKTGARALMGKRKRPPRSQRIHRRRMLALQRRTAKSEVVTSRD